MTTECSTSMGKSFRRLVARAKASGWSCLRVSLRATFSNRPVCAIDVAGEPPSKEQLADHDRLFHLWRRGMLFRICITFGLAIGYVVLSVIQAAEVIRNEGDLSLWQVAVFLLLLGMQLRLGSAQIDSFLTSEGDTACIALTEYQRVNEMARGEPVIQRYVGRVLVQDRELRRFELDQIVQWTVDIARKRVEDAADEAGRAAKCQLLAAEVLAASKHQASQAPASLPGGGLSST